MKLRKVFGIGSILVGIVNILNFYSPIPIPTVGLSAFIVGGIFIASGLLILNTGPGSSGRLRVPLSKLFRSLASPKKKLDPLLPVRVLKLASERSGELTVSAVAMALNITLEDAQAALDDLMGKGAATAEVELSTGVTTYSFPEFISSPGAVMENRS